MIRTVNVESGYYFESGWEIPNNKLITINGEGKDMTFITAGPQNYDSFIILNESFFFFFF
jgi:hypothetical protein